MELRAKLGSGEVAHKVIPLCKVNPDRARRVSFGDRGILDLKFQG